MITHECILKNYSVDEWSVIRFNCEKIFMQDGVEIGRSPESYVLVPGDDASAHEQYVQDICAQVHTQAVIDAWLARGPL